MRPGRSATTGGGRPGRTSVDPPPDVPPAGFSLVEKKVFSGAAVTSYSFAGLLGNTDGIYLLDYRIKTPSSISLFLRPNGVTTGCSIMQNTGVGNSGDAFIGVQGAGAGNWVFGSLIFHAVTAGGQRRTFTAVYSWGEHNPAECRTVIGVWDDMTTEVTSLNLVSSVAGGIVADSMATLYRGRCIA